MMITTTIKLGQDGMPAGIDGRDHERPVAERRTGRNPDCRGDRLVREPQAERLKHLVEPADVLLRPLGISFRSRPIRLATQEAKQPVGVS